MVSANMRIFGRNVRLPWRLTSVETQPGSSALLPMGTPVSQAFTVQGGAAGKPIRHTLAVIDRLHGDGEIPPMVAESQLLKDLNGKFTRDQGVFVNTGSLIPEITTAHEIAHALDLYGFTSGRNESTNGHEIAQVMDACRGSHAYRDLQTLRSRLASSLTSHAEEDRRQKDLNRVNYLMRLNEVWARAYAQWVATSSQDPILLKQLATLRQDPEYARFFVQWSDDDFQPIGREIEILFRRKGWIH